MAQPREVNPTAKHANRYWGSTPLPTSKKEFFDAVTTPAPSGDGTVATIRLYGPIDSYGGFWGISAKDVSTILDAFPDSVKQIVLRINSPGGEVFEGNAILNLFRAHEAKVLAVVDGLAASAASFIAAGADETVMMPGTQMMIHSPSTITWGNASDLRHDADVLDSIEQSIVEIYTAKAGEQDWASLLSDETWLTAAKAVELGLADRVAVIPNAGETETAGADDDVIEVPDPDEPEDAASATVVRVLGRAPGTQYQARANAPELPSSTEPGAPNRKETAVTNSDLTAGLRERLGITDAKASDEQLLAAVDALKAKSTAFTPPQGTVLVDEAQWEDVRSMATDGQQALATLAKARRTGIVDKAVEDGRIAASAKDTWFAQLEANEDGAVALLGTLQKNTIPRAEIGRSDEPATAEDSVYDELFGAEKTGA